MLCFWCSVKEIKAPDGTPNPAYMPCGSCTRKMATGVVVVEITEEPQAVDHVGLDIGRVIYPTGLWAVMSPAWLRGRMSENPALEPTLVGQGYCFIDGSVWNLLGLDRPEVAEGA